MNLSLDVSQKVLGFSVRRRGNEIAKMILTSDRKEAENAFFAPRQVKQELRGYRPQS